MALIIIYHKPSDAPVMAVITHNESGTEASGLGETKQQAKIAGLQRLKEILDQLHVTYDATDFLEVSNALL